MTAPTTDNRTHPPASLGDRPNSPIEQWLPYLDDINHGFGQNLLEKARAVTAAQDRVREAQRALQLALEDLDQARTETFSAVSRRRSADEIQQAISQAAHNARAAEKNHD